MQIWILKIVFVSLLLVLALVEKKPIQQVSAEVRARIFHKSPTTQPRHLETTY